MRYFPSVAHEGLRFGPDGAHTRYRSLPEEVPVAMVYDGSTQAVLMASPGGIADLAHGFSLTEGIVSSLAEIEGFEVAEHLSGIEARFWLSAAQRDALAHRRRFMAGPVGCGLCGIDSLEQAARPVPRVTRAVVSVAAEAAAGAVDALRARQPLADRTHATHAAGLLVPGRGIVTVREDVGRHNALDKLIGALLRGGGDARSGALVMTSRLSVELVQKCAMAGCSVLIGASAPTAHAARVAGQAGITLVAFARNGACEVYTHPARIVSQEGARVT